MTAARCGNCGGPILHEVGRAPLATALTCPRCSAGARASNVEPPAETVSIADAGAAAGVDGALDPYRTGIIVLESHEPAGPAPAVEVKVRGFLTQEGLPPDEADFRLRGLTVVGRRECQIAVDDPAVSARHFQIEERDGQFFLRDLDSSNGTLLNDRLVRSAQLQTGDRIQVGSTRFVFSVRHSIPT